MPANVEILAIGTELLIGSITNTNARFLSEELAGIGINVLYHSVCGDNPKRLAACLEIAFGRVDTVITSGGLGPTADDLTKETIAAFFGRKMVMHEPSKKRIIDFFARHTGAVMTENNLKQAMMPEGAMVLDNDWGTAPGCIIEDGNRRLIMLPGPPREIMPMYHYRVKPYLERLSDECIHSRMIHICGIGESAVDAKLGYLFDGVQPTVAPYARTAEMMLRVTAKGKNVAECEEICQPVIDEICEKLGKNVYGIDVDSLEEVVVRSMASRGLKIAAAESCTGGLLTKRLTDISGASDVLDMSIVTYANEVKHRLGVAADIITEKGAVSAECARALAQGIRKLSGADIGVGITGIAGPTGGSIEKPVGLVYIALSTAKGDWVKRTMNGRGGDERELVRTSAATKALDMVRRLLETNWLP